MAGSRKMGVCLFDDPDQYGSKAVRGWACVPGADPFPVDCVGNLTSSAYWLTNISNGVCYTTGLSSNPRVFSSEYMRTRVQSIALELGIKDLPLEEQVVYLADVFDRVMGMADTLFGVDLPPKTTLAGGLAEIHGIEHPDQAQDVAQACYEACQGYSSCERRNKGNQTWTTLMLHRYRHARDLLSHPIPTGQFHFLMAGDMPPPSQRLRWFLDLPMPAMAEVEIVCRDPDLSRLVNYGSGAGDFRRQAERGRDYHIGNKRCFCAAPEIAMLAEFCEIYITGVMISNDPAAQPLCLPEHGRALQVSYSYGLLLENLWVALTRNRMRGTIKRSPATAWLQCIDRKLCLDKARALVADDVEIVSYGYGRITIGIDEDRWDELPAIAMKHHLIPPVMLNGRYRPDCTDSLTIDQAISVMHTNGQLEKVMEFDMKAYDWLRRNRRVA